MSSIYEQLLALADARPALLTSFREDLTEHDQRTCRNMQPGDRWLWLLRRNGTQLMPVGQGHDAVLVTHWLEVEPECRAYLLTPTQANGEAGNVAAISHARARKLAFEPPPEDQLCWRDGMWSAVLVRGGCELGKVSNMTGRGWHAYVGRTMIGLFSDHLTAKAEVMKRFPA